MSHETNKNAIHEMFDRWKNSKTGQRDIAQEVAKEVGVFKNSRQRYRARRKEEFLSRKRGEHVCYMFECHNHAIKGEVAKSELGEGYFRVIPKKGGEVDDSI